MSGKAGRPAPVASLLSGPAAATLEKGRFYLTLTEYGVTVDTIAAKDGVARSAVYRAINLARAHTLVLDERPARLRRGMKALMAPRPEQSPDGQS